MTDINSLPKATVAKNLLEAMNELETVYHLARNNCELLDDVHNPCADTARGAVENSSLIALNCICETLEALGTEAPVNASKHEENDA